MDNDIDHSLNSDPLFFYNEIIKELIEVSKVDQLINLFHSVIDSLKDLISRIPTTSINNIQITYTFYIKDQVIPYYGCPSFTNDFFKKDIDYKKNKYHSVFIKLLNELEECLFLLISRKRLLLMVMKK